MSITPAILHLNISFEMFKHKVYGEERSYAAGGIFMILDPNFSSPKQELLHLAETELTSSEQAENTAKTLIDLIEKFPELKQDEDSAKSLCNITEKLFTFKEDLSTELKPQKDFNTSVEVGWDAPQPSRMARNIK
jgi:hypothetical protein